MDTLSAVDSHCVLNCLRAAKFIGKAAGLAPTTYPLPSATTTEQVSAGSDLLVTQWFFTGKCAYFSKLGYRI